MMKCLGCRVVAALLSVMGVMNGAVSPSLAADASLVKAYEPGALAPGDYSVIERLWVSRRLTAFDVPRHRDVESAQQALLREAARVGGDGVVNMHCVQAAGMVERWGGHYCYGNVIKLK